MRVLEGLEWIGFVMMLLLVALLIVECSGGDAVPYVM